VKWKGGDGAGSMHWVATGGLMGLPPQRMRKISNLLSPDLFFQTQSEPKPVFGWGSVPDPAGGAYDAPTPPSRLVSTGIGRGPRNLAPQRSTEHPVNLHVRLMCCHTCRCTANGRMVSSKACKPRLYPYSVPGTASLVNLTLNMRYKNDKNIKFVVTRSFSQAQNAPKSVLALPQIP